MAEFQEFNITLENFNYKIPSKRLDLFIARYVLFKRVGQKLKTIKEIGHYPNYFAATLNLHYFQYQQIQPLLDWESEHRHLLKTINLFPSIHDSLEEELIRLR